MNTKNEIISNLYTALLLWEGANINPNGDPDNEGAPRTDPETSHGLISPQAITSRAHRRIAEMSQLESPYNIQIRRGVTIETAILEGVKRAKIKPSKKLNMEDRRAATKMVCKDYVDTRMTGAVLNVGSCPVEGVNGVITFAWGRSVYPVLVHETGLTRACATTEEQGKDREMGRTHNVAHGVYTQAFFVNPHHAAQNGATMLDLAIYLDNIINAYEFNRSVMSGQVNLRGLWLFKHESKFGNAPAHTLLERVQITSDAAENSRNWDDYDLRFDAANLPSTISVFTLEQLLGGHEAILEALTE